MLKVLDQYLGHLNCILNSVTYIFCGFRQVISLSLSQSPHV